jgi:hypothetical protein
MNATHESIDARVTSGGAAQARGRPSAGLPGNPFARKVAQLRAALVNFVTEDDMKHLCFVLKMRAEGGNMQAMKLLFQYVLGRPTQTVDPDRLDVDEWQKMQEKSRSPEEATKILGGLPAQTVCEVTKVAWPCAVDQAFKQPLLAGLRVLDERDANANQPAAGSPPSTKRENGPPGEPPQSPNGPNGPLPAWWATMMEEVLAANRLGS